MADEQDNWIEILPSGEKRQIKRGLKPCVTSARGSVLVWRNRIVGPYVIALLKLKPLLLSDLHGTIVISAKIADETIWPDDDRPRRVIRLDDLDTST
jgi:hypothetical protein